MIKYITIHNIYLMSVLNKLCLDFWNLKSLSRGSRQPVLDYRDYCISLVFKARMRHKEETQTLHKTMRQYYYSLHHRTRYHININD